MARKKRKPVTLAQMQGMSTEELKDLLQSSQGELKRYAPTIDRPDFHRLPEKQQERVLQNYHDALLRAKNIHTILSERKTEPNTKQFAAMAARLSTAET